MTEQAYIDTRDLSTVIHLRLLLDDITIDNQPNIPEAEYREVVRKVTLWRDKLFEAIHVHTGDSSPGNTFPNETETV